MRQRSCTESTRFTVFSIPPASLRDSIPTSATIAGGAGTALERALLVVDDDPQMLTTLTSYFERCGFRVFAAATTREAKTMFERRSAWTLVISDFHLPDGTGAELCDWIRARRAAPPPFLLMSGSVNGEVETTGMDFLAKPFPLDQLEKQVGALLARK